MKILHTADWHIGKLLYSKKRYDEFEKFLLWLVEKIEKECFDVLLIAGDIFDTTTPSNKAQELYNNFLAKLVKTTCRHVIVVGGNHDSPSLLNSQRNILKLLHIHVIGSAEATLKDEVLVLRGKDDKEELIVCAVPYLRDRDIRKAEAYESLDEKANKVIEGISKHYTEVCAYAKEIQASLSHRVPIVAMGHLFTAGGQSAQGDGMRELYVGSLGHVHANLFPICIDYLALGHLHSAQKVGGNNHMRYSGSPLPMSFDEACHTKKVISIEFDKSLIPVIQELDIPTFKQLKRIKGDWEAIFAQIEDFKDCKALLEVVYTGSEYIDYALKEKLEKLLEGTCLELLKIENQRKKERIINEGSFTLSLDDLKPIDVFKDVLKTNHVNSDEHLELIARFDEVVIGLFEREAAIV